MKVTISISDVGLHYKEPQHCKVCNDKKPVLLACITLYVDSKEIFKVWTPICKDCYKELYNKFLEFNER